MMPKHVVFQIHQVENGWLLISEEHLPLTNEEKKERFDLFQIVQDYKEVQKRFVFNSSDELLAGFAGLLAVAEMPAAN